MARQRAPRVATCPSCGREVRPVPIVFGYPTPETFESADRGEVLLGGCVVDGNEPTARCPECRTDLQWSDGRYEVHIA